MYRDKDFRFTHAQRHEHPSVARSRAAAPRRREVETLKASEYDRELAYFRGRRGED